MAELTEADKRTLLGDNYREVLEKAQEEGHASRATYQLWVAHVEKCRNNKFSAFAIALVGGILLVSNLYAVSGPSILLVSIIGIVGLILGIGWYGYTSMTLRKLQANRPPS